MIKKGDGTPQKEPVYFWSSLQKMRKREGERDWFFVQESQNRRPAREFKRNRQYKKYVEREREKDR